MIPLTSIPQAGHRLLKVGPSSLCHRPVSLLSCTKKEPAIAGLKHNPWYATGHSKTLQTALPF